MAKKSEELYYPWPIFETHCHLDYLKRFSLEELLEKCKINNIQKLLTIGVSPDHQNTILEIAQSYDHIYCSQGIHPHHANEYSPEITDLIKHNAKHNKVIAIGEIGLDYHYDYSPRAVQIRVFEQQLALALELDKPIIIHTREADEDTLSILKNISGQTKHLVLHSYTSQLPLAEFALSEGYYIGFNGILTFKNAQNVRNILHAVPLKSLVLETDSPFLAPTPHRGIENGPHLIPFIAQRIAEEKQCNIEDVLTTAWNNSLTLFKL